MKVEVWTDGACEPNPGRGGWACIIHLYGDDGSVIKEVESSGFSWESTNNRMELQAAIEGLRRVNQPCDVTIYSDSRYLVNTMMRGWKRKKNLDLWKELDGLVGNQLSVEFRWVPGHAGHHFNERCDLLAARAIL